jgi:hypothetical protein
MPLEWNILLKISGICQYSTYSMPFIVRSASLAKSLWWEYDPDTYHHYHILSDKSLDASRERSILYIHLMAYYTISVERWFRFSTPRPTEAWNRAGHLMRHVKNHTTAGKKLAAFVPWQKGTSFPFQSKHVHLQYNQRCNPPEVDAVV